MTDELLLASGCLLFAEGQFGISHSINGTETALPRVSTIFMFPCSGLSVKRKLSDKIEANGPQLRSYPIDLKTGRNPNCLGILDVFRKS